MPAGEDEPAIERGCPAFTSAAGSDAKGGCDSLDDIAEANLLVANEPWKADPVRWMVHLCAIGFFFIHGNLLIAFGVSRD